MQGIILEGIHGAGKTATMSRIRQSGGGDGSLIFLSEAYTQRLTGNNDVDPGSVVNLLGHYVDFLERSDRIFNSSALAMHERKRELELRVLLETFVFGNLLLRGWAFEEGFRELDARLGQLGFTMGVLLVPDDAIEERCIDSTRRARGKRWMTYQDGLAPTRGLLVQFYRRQQEQLREWASQSLLAVQLIDTGDMDWERVALSAATIGSSGKVQIR